MPFSLFHIRNRWAGPLACLMALAILSPVSPHLAEGVALCLGEDHVGVEATGASHHAGQAAPVVSADAKNANAEKSAQPTSPRRAFLESASQASPVPSSSGEDECVDVPLRLVKTGDACYQAVPSSGGEQVPSLFASQSLFARARAQVPSAPASDVHEPRRPRAAVPPPSPPSSSTVVLLI